MCELQRKATMKVSPRIIFTFLLVKPFSWLTTKLILLNLIKFYYSKRILFPFSRGTDQGLCCEFLKLWRWNRDDKPWNKILAVPEFWLQILPYPYRHTHLSLPKLHLDLVTTHHLLAIIFVSNLFVILQ